MIVVIYTVAKIAEICNTMDCKHGWEVTIRFVHQWFCFRHIDLFHKHYERNKSKFIKSSIENALKMKIQYKFIKVYLALSKLIVINELYQ